MHVLKTDAVIRRRADTEWRIQRRGEKGACAFSPLVWRDAGRE